MLVVLDAPRPGLGRRRSGGADGICNIAARERRTQPNPETTMGAGCPRGAYGLQQWAASWLLPVASRPPGEAATSRLEALPLADCKERLRAGRSARSGHADPDGDRVTAGEGRSRGSAIEGECDAGRRALALDSVQRLQHGNLDQCLDTHWEPALPAQSRRGVENRTAGVRRRPATGKSVAQRRAAVELDDPAPTPSRGAGPSQVEEQSIAVIVMMGALAVPAGQHAGFDARAPRGGAEVETRRQGPRSCAGLEVLVQAHSRPVAKTIRAGRHRDAGDQPDRGGTPRGRSNKPDQRHHLPVPETVRGPRLGRSTERGLSDLLDGVREPREERHPVQRTPYAKGGDSVLALALLSRSFVERVRLGEVPIFEAIADLR